MLTRNWFARFAVAIGVSAAVAASAAAQTPSRIAGEVQNEVRVTLSGTTSPLVGSSRDTGRMAGTQNLGRMLLMLAPSAGQERAAKQFVDDLHNPSSPSFHQWLTPAQFGQRFGISDEDAAKVQQWLQGEGLTVHEIAQGRRFIVFSGTVEQVEHAFSTEMHSYTYSGKEFVANATEIKIPAALATVVKGVVRLHSDPRRANAYMGGKVHYDKKSGHFDGGDGGHYLVPADFAKIYNIQPLYDAGINGSGQTIAIVGRSNIDVTNVTAFRSLFGLPANDPQVIVNGDDPGQTGDMTEAMLDVTWSGAVAPNAAIKFVVSQSNFADGIDVSASYIVDHNLAPIMSTSYGACEASLGTVQAAFYNALWQQAAAEGITSFVSAGDNGGAGCDAPGSGYYAYSGLAVSGIASTPYNIAVGGSQFDDVADPSAYWAATSDPVTLESALGYIPEKIWNESSNDPNDASLWAGSGGVSSIYAKPAWQASPGVPNDGKRDLPDISLTAALHDGYLVCMFSSCSYGEYFYTFGGTSASSPSAAGIMALVNQKLGGGRQGVANYVFYRLASSSGVFHDITKGDNKVPDPLGQFTVGYDAGAGYDLASGLGSFDANALANNWAAASAGTSSTVTLALANGQHSSVVHGTPVNFQATVACSGAGCTAPTGDVALLASPVHGSSLGVGAASLNPSSTGSTADFATAKVPGGPYSVTARYSGDGKYYAGTSKAVALSITPEASHTYLGAIGGGAFTTAPLTVGYGLPLQIGIIVAGDSGVGYPSGKMSLLSDGKPVIAVWIDPSTGNPTTSTLTLNYGENSTILAPGVNTISQSSTIAYLPPYLTTSPQTFPAGTHVLQATYPGDASFSTSSSNAYTFTVAKADTFIADFFTVGTAVAGVPVHIAGETGLTSNGYAPYGGTITVTDVTSGTPVVLGSAPLSPTYGGSYDVPVTFTSAITHSVVLSFSGDSNTNPSLGNYVVPISANAPPYVTLSADVTNAVVGSPVTLSAQVASDVRTYTATGTVTFLDGATTIGAATLDTTGTATLVIKTLIAGTHTITANYNGDAILTASVSNPITEMIADYTLQAQPANLTITAGQSGSATISIIPLGGSTQSVTLSCASLPANITCSFSPASVTLDGLNPKMVNVTISTGSASASASPKNHLWSVASALAFACLLVPFGRRKHMKTWLGMVAMLAIALFGVGCGSSSKTTPPSKLAPAGTYVVNVSASGGTGTTAKTIPLLITVTK